MGYITPQDLIELGFDLSDIKIENQQSICDTASSIAEGYCQQKLGCYAMPGAELPLRTEIVDARGRLGKVTAALSRFPVVKIKKAVMLKGSKENGVDVAKIRIYSDEKIITFASCYSGELELDLEYWHGYETIPNEIISAVKIIAAQLLDNHIFADGANFWGMDSVKQGDVSVSRQGSDIPNATAKMLLNPFRRVC